MASFANLNKEFRDDFQTLLKTTVRSAFDNWLRARSALTTYHRKVETWVKEQPNGVDPSFIECWRAAYDYRRRSVQPLSTLFEISQMIKTYRKEGPKIPDSQNYLGRLELAQSYYVQCNTWRQCYEDDINSKLALFQESKKKDLKQIAVYCRLQELQLFSLEAEAYGK